VILATGSAASYTASGASPFTPISKFLLQVQVIQNYVDQRTCSTKRTLNFTVDQFLLKKWVTAGLDSVEERER